MEIVLALLYGLPSAFGLKLCTLVLVIFFIGNLHVISYNGTILIDIASISINSQYESKILNDNKLVADFRLNPYNILKSRGIDKLDSVSRLKNKPASAKRETSLSDKAILLSHN